eukprot:PhM_4_TR11483/c0_g1_i1/m.57038/K07953/SAR1; GTP-binding protein SAR1
MGWFDWFWDIMSYLGIGGKQGKILFLGLDNAGKTTLLGKLTTDQIHIHRPTVHPNVEDLALGGIKLKTFDLGGHQEARRLWRDYFTKCDAVVFMVDAAAPDRFGDVKAELDLLLQAEELSKAPFLVLGNKIDLAHKAVSEDSLKASLGLTGLTTGKSTSSGSSGAGSNVRPLEVFMCSVVKRTGYGDGFRWLSQYLKNM